MAEKVNVHYGRAYELPLARRKELGLGRREYDRYRSFMERGHENVQHEDAMRYATAFRQGGSNAK